MSSGLSRRRFVRAAATGTVASLTLPGVALLLEACSAPPTPANPPAATANAPAPTATVAAIRPTSVPTTDTDTSTVAGSATQATRSTGIFPTYIPVSTGPKPDLPSTGPLYEDGFTYFPTNPSRTWTKDPPGRGGPVSTFSTFPVYVPPTPVDQNPTWQEVNRQLNATLQFEYGDVAKLGAVIAGNEYPDQFIFYGGLTGTAQVSPIPNLPQFLQQAAADLTPYLSGDAIKDYPNLAAIPTFAWKNAGCVYNGHLFMIPVERYKPGYAAMRNSDIYDVEIGPNYLPKNADDFKRVLQQLNKPKDNRFAWGGPGFASELPFFASLFGAPNGWRLETDGTLAKDFETPQFKDMIAFWRDLVAAGVTHPDAYTKNEPGTRGYLAAQTVMAGLTFGVSWTDLWYQSRSLQPPPTYLLLPPFSAYDNTKPVHHMIGGYIAATGMKKASQERILELLRIADWLAAPFGSSEDLLMTYGVPEVDYNIDSSGRPIVTSRSNSDTAGVQWKYIVQRPQVMSFSGWPEYARLAYDYEHQAIPVGIDDPTWGLVSATSGSKGFTLSQAVVDGLRAVVMGQRPLSDFDQIVKDWQTGGGNQIRAEYQQAIAAAHG